MQLSSLNSTRWITALTGIALALTLALVPANAAAQASSSAVNGVVTDAEQAVVPNAKVALRNVDTNVERDTETNATGDYFFSNVTPAHYTLMFSHAGFQTETISAFEVGVAQAVSINTSLKL